ncbi:MAG: hypothetical protein LBV72_00675 [Tannerella sp.]|jgi:hypothetical protein|nr:hypothetical protein [Tannerella sp.]
MNKKSNSKATAYSSRISENNVLQNPGFSVLCPGWCTRVAAGSKIKGTPAPLFFYHRQRSKVIFRVTQNSLRILLNYYRKYLALRGCDHAKDKSGSPKIYPLLQNPLPVVASFEVTSAAFCLAPDGRKTMGCGGKPAFHLPVVAFTASCMGAVKHPKGFNNIKYRCYGK